MLAVLVAAGCGGGGGGSSSEPLTREQYASKADSVCGNYSQQAKALAPADPSNLSEFANVADKTLPLLDNALKDLRKLKPPADERATADRWLAAIEQLKADLKEIRDKAKSNDLQGLQGLIPKATADNQKANALATQLGMTVCNKD